MHRIIKFFILITVLYSGCAHIALANFEITEIMYDLDGTDTNREWVEVKNIGTDVDDLSKWYFFSDNSKHSLSPQGASLVPAGGYAVISQNAAKFKTDWPNFAGLLFDSSWTGFSNDGETIALKDPDSNIVSTITFISATGGAGNGDSLQNINGTWSGANPTPGLANSVSSSSGGGGVVTTAPTGSSSSTSTTPIVKKKELENPKIVTNIITNTTTVAGLAFKIRNETLGYNKENIKVGKFVWNLGDGITRIEGTTEPFSHTYAYSGEYLVTLSFYQSHLGTTPDATDRLIIKVVPSEIYISSAGNFVDPYIELENKSANEVDLSKWYIKSQFRSFFIPDGTIILPNNKLKFSPKTTYFDVNDISSFTLHNPTGDIFSTYPFVLNKNIQEKAYFYPPNNNSKSIKNLLPANDVSEISEVSNANTENTQVIDLNNLGAQVATSSFEGIDSKLLSWIGLGIVIIIGVISVILIRRDKEEYIEKELTASDIKIIE